MVVRRPLVTVGGAIRELSDADILITDSVVGMMLYQNDGTHSVGVGRLAIAWVVPCAMVIDKVRYWCATAGTGDAATAELRLNGTASGNTIAGSSGSAAVSSPIAAMPNVSVVAGDRIFVYQTAINSTTVGVGLAAEIMGHRV
ncbi:hypothetical protein D5S18_22120 [Nocardia panacis]|uniref:Uncharacterized protein n=1 Tax=Nocardia panacis TaxID=2340916 RepID=A0A3A4JT17_9NOCA|nr:hypothetical protein [Nocardia panacis]RJO72975.1 hypothetical protein D5S18_22120 [Nocardia panacis]